MFKFIFYFIFFGLLFYGMHVYTPDAFNMLQTWAANVYGFVTNLVHQFMPSNITPAS